MTKKPVAESQKLLREGADARLRQRLAGIADHSIRVVIDRLVEEAACDLQMRPPTLTDAEREAISAAACICEDAGRTDIAIIVNTALSRLG
jgi:hypothetical protein